MPTAAEHLAQYNVTVEQANAFIFGNLHNLPFILQVADNFGVTNQMLAEIVGGVTAADVVYYFSIHGLDSSVLEEAPPAEEEPPYEEPPYEEPPYNDPYGPMY